MCALMKSPTDMKAGVFALKMMRLGHRPVLNDSHLDLLQFWLWLKGFQGTLSWSLSWRISQLLAFRKEWGVKVSKTTTIAWTFNGNRSIVRANKHSFIWCNDCCTGFYSDILLALYAYFIQQSLTEPQSDGCHGAHRISCAFSDRHPRSTPSAKFNEIDGSRSPVPLTGQARAPFSLPRHDGGIFFPLFSLSSWSAWWFLIIPYAETLSHCQCDSSRASSSPSQYTKSQRYGAERQEVGYEVCIHDNCIDFDST